MTEIYLIRHTQAEGNLYHMMQGHWDGGVTPLGRRQIAALTERFRGVPVDAVYSSDLYRAVSTAEAVARPKGLPVHTDSRLREINVGPWEAQYFGNAFYREPEAFQRFIYEPEKFYLEGAETYAQVGDRVYEALTENAAAHDGQTVAVASHGVSIRCALSRITGTPLKDMPLSGNTGVSHLFFDGVGFTADYINDVSHLPEALRRQSAQPSLRHVSIDPQEHERFYKACYEDAWLSAHGNLAGYAGQAYFDSALSHFRHDPEAVCVIYDGEEPAGLIDLDTQRGVHAGYGWISLLYLRPEYRGRGLGVQLLARAMFKYEAMGRGALRLHVSEDNAPALAFYRRWGFEALSTEPGARWRLCLMEKKLGGHRDV